MLNAGDINKSFLEVFNSMESDIPYEFNSKAFENLNVVRKKHNYSQFKPFSFQRDKNKLIFNWLENNWSPTIVEIDCESPNAYVAFAVSYFAFAFACAVAENQIQKVKKDTCDGEIVEIKGKKYKLTLQK